MMAGKPKFLKDIQAIGGVYQFNKGRIDSGKKFLPRPGYQQ